MQEIVFKVPTSHKIGKKGVYYTEKHLSLKSYGHVKLSPLTSKMIITGRRLRFIGRLELDVDSHHLEQTKPRCFLFS